MAENKNIIGFLVIIGIIAYVMSLPTGTFPSQLKSFSFLDSNIPQAISIALIGLVLYFLTKD